MKQTNKTNKQNPFSKLWWIHSAWLKNRYAAIEMPFLHIYS